jgi:hypothetical protein
MRLSIGERHKCASQSSIGGLFRFGDEGGSPCLGLPQWQRLKMEIELSLLAERELFLGGTMSIKLLVLVYAEGVGLTQ